MIKETVTHVEIYPGKAKNRKRTSRENSEDFDNNRIFAMVKSDVQDTLREVDKQHRQGNYDLVQKEKKSIELRKDGHNALLPAEGGVSTGKSSAQYLDKSPGFVKRVRERKMKPISNEGQHIDLTSICDGSSKQIAEKNEKFEDELEQEVEGSFVYGEKTPKVSVTRNKSERKHSSFDVDATKHVLAIVNKDDNFLESSHPSPERARVPYSRRKLLILDVNGLLADIVSPPPKECKAEINIASRAIFKRPFCCDFLKFCFERFDVGIWSSRTKKIIDRVVDYLLGDMKHKLLFCWDLSHCTETCFRTLENRHKPLVFKELRKIWENNDPNLLWKKGDFNESNSLLLDDSPYKALLNPMHTAIFPCSYNFRDRSDNSLGPGGDLRVYLEGLAAAENVQKHVEHHPFGQSAINQTSPSWGFYLRVISSRSSVSTRR
uniref:Mitochondrial import inner membrane translocase subunit TIM50 n=1 Tax=Davidia involucrata TaxID=16924 RepID=A0A5B7BKL6_DAVIN